jgi:hypothetical protein
MSDDGIDLAEDEAALAAVLGDFAHRAPLGPLGPRPRRRRWLAAAAVGVGLAAAAVVALWAWPRASSCTGTGGFAFTSAGGARCGGGVATRGALPVGAWLETSASPAEVQIADIGEVTLLGDSRLRLVGTGPTGHHLELARGRLRARVTAPPRLFVVDTPTAVAVDLGCAYELAVDAAGRTLLQVTSGAVSLEGGGHVAYVPRGAEVIARAGRGPGTPVRHAAAAALREAVARFDEGGAASAPILALVDVHDLLGRTDGAARAAVLARLDALAARPVAISTDALLAGEPGALEALRQGLLPSWQREP